MTESAKNIETRAIDSLLHNSYLFEVPLSIKPKSVPKLIKIWNRWFPNHQRTRHDKRIPKYLEIKIKEVTDKKTGKQSEQYICKLNISPLYLGTIDSIRKLYLRIDYNEKLLQQDPLIESRKLFKHIDTITEIASVATLNASPNNLKNYNKQLKELKHFYKENLTPATLLQLIQLISFMSNQVDFTNSIRLTQIAGTTAPKANPIE